MWRALLPRLRSGRWLIACGGAALLPCVLLAAEDSEVPVTHRHRGLLLRPAEADRLTRSALESLAQHALPDDDPRVTAVRAVGQRLIAGAEHSGLTPRFIVSEDARANAFSVGSASIVVFTGLLEMLQDQAREGLVDSETALARVLSHELGHLIAAHAREKFNVVPLQLSILALAAVSPPAAVGAAAADLLLHELPLWRTLELEADAIGLSLLASAGYDPSAAAEYFRVRDFRAEVRDVVPELLAEALPESVSHLALPELLCEAPSDRTRAEHAEQLLAAAELAAALDTAGEPPPLQLSAATAQVLQ
jgi:predicted Zn-dependent protease